MPFYLKATALLLAGLTLAAADGAAQRPRPAAFPQRRGSTLHFNPSGEFPSYDGGFHFRRLWFRQSFTGDGDGWYVDYPRAGENL